MRRDGNLPSAKAAATVPNDTFSAAAASDELQALRERFAQAVRRLRRQQNLSTRALAAQVGVTSGFISQLENAQTMPSIATVVKLASALQTRVGDLFESPISSSQLVRRDERPRFEYPDTGITDEILSSDPTDRLQVLMGYLNPGAHGGELYTHGADTEFVYAVAGEVTLLLGDDEHLLREGDAMTFSGDIPHGYVNRSSKPAQTIWVMTPVSY